MMSVGSVALLAILLTYATISDLRRHKIPNSLTFPIIIGGLVLQLVLYGRWESLAGAAAAFLILIYPVASHWVGAGDLKLVVAVGVLMGPIFVSASLLLFVITLVVISVINQIQKRVAQPIPAAVPMTAGCALVLIFSF